MEFTKIEDSGQFHRIFREYWSQVKQFQKDVNRERGLLGKSGFHIYEPDLFEARKERYFLGTYPSELIKKDNKIIVYGLN